MDRTMRIAVLVTCHNRIEVTLRGLRSLVDALENVEGLTYELFAVDDGSKDGTADAILRSFPRAHVDVGDGTLFWNGGMRRAFQISCGLGPFDGYLLFNDDVVVEKMSAATFFGEYLTLNLDASSILVGATVQEEGDVSYSGFFRPSKFRPLRLHKLPVTGAAQPCHTFNGNFVLVPGKFFESAGGLDEHYVHAYGDIDLGYVALKAGVQPYLCSVPIGLCASNAPGAGSRESPRLASALLGTLVKKDSLRQRLHFLCKHSPLPALIVSLPLTVVRFGLRRFLQSGA